VLSRSQLVVYGAVAVALLLLGARWIRSADAQSPPTGVSYAPGSSNSGSSGSASGSFAVDSQGGGDVVVDVAGAVGKPGVYRLPAGTRVNDAIQRAGGATARADAESINLAARLSDGQQIVVPNRAKSLAGVAAASPAPGTDAASTGPISLGSATVAQLDTIEGIGPVTAQDIVDFRDQRGGISSVDQLDQISGIGPATMDVLRARLQP
jgi:competence protein ComEA